jgi:hypothetical protein
VLLEIRCRSATGQSDVFWRRFAETLESELSLVERTDFLGEFGFYTLREGIVCKRKDSPYKVTEKPSRYWIKVKKSRYSQLERVRNCSNDARFKSDVHIPQAGQPSMLDCDRQT